MQPIKQFNQTTEVYTKVTKKNLLEIKSPLDRLDLTEDMNVKSNNNVGDRVVKSN